MNRPPPKYRWAGVVQDLQARPGQWDMVDSDIPCTSTYGWRRLKELGCEVTTRWRGHRMDLWARWPE